MLRTEAKRFLAYLANLLETIAEYDDGNKNVDIPSGHHTARFLNHSSEKEKKEEGRKE